jgi:signal peptidase II
MTGLARLVPAFVLAFVFDWFTKQWAEQSLVLYQPVPVVGQWIQLTLGYNSGVAFGLFAHGGVWLALASGAVLAGTVVWLLYTFRTGGAHSALAWPMGLLLGGGVANLLDRLPDGRVTDFIDIGLGVARWPTFNVADSCIVVAVATFLLLNTRKTLTEG